MPGHSLENVNVDVGGSTPMQPRPSRWMQYHQLVELLLDASHASVMLYGPFTVRRRFVGAVGHPGHAAAAALAAAPGRGAAMRTSASTSTLAARTVRRTDNWAPPGSGGGSPVADVGRSRPDFSTTRLQSGFIRNTSPRRCRSPGRCGRGAQPSRPTNRGFLVGARRKLRRLLRRSRASRPASPRRHGRSAGTRSRPAARARRRRAPTRRRSDGGFPRPARG